MREREGVRESENASASESRNENENKSESESESEIPFLEFALEIGHVVPGVRTLSRVPFGW